MSDYEKHRRKRDAQRYRSTRLWAPNPNEIGMLGERAWAQWCGIEQDLRDRPEGDRGIELMIKIRTRSLGPREFASDVKTTKYSNEHLIENPKKIENGKIYVLARAHMGEKTARLLGWCWGYVLKQGTLNARFDQENEPRYIRHHSILEDMADLRAIFISARHATIDDSWWKPKEAKR